jgi:hypothetical protein
MEFQGIPSRCDSRNFPSLITQQHNRTNECGYSSIHGLKVTCKLTGASYNNIIITNKDILLVQRYYPTKHISMRMIYGYFFCLSITYMMNIQNNSFHIRTQSKK